MTSTVHMSVVQQANRDFIEAVIAFSVDPGPDNLGRYLDASRALEKSRRQYRRRSHAGSARARSSLER